VGRSLVEAALFSWEGLKASHILKGSGEDAVPFSVHSVALLLDERQDIADKMQLALIAALNKRRKDFEGAKKN
jgi:hypothetical protein